MNINNKIKQFFSKSWGKPSKTEQKKPLQLELFDQEVPKYNKKKRKHRIYRDLRSICPFCDETLEEMPTNHNNNDFFTRYVKSYSDYCKCGAHSGVECPSCGRETWYLNEIYKHQWMGCGFAGKKLYR